VYAGEVATFPSLRRIRLDMQKYTFPTELRTVRKNKNREAVLKIKNQGTTGMAGAADT